MLLPALYAVLSGNASPPTTSPIAAYLSSPNANAIHIGFAIKGTNAPFLVLNLVAAPPAESSLDGISILQEGEIQFDCYASTPQAARKLSRATRDYLMLTFTSGLLPDGTQIEFVDVTLDQDEPYELGGDDYIYRSLLRLKAFWTEGQPD